MSWQIQYTRKFLKEMSALPVQTRKRIEAIAFGEEIKQDAFLSGKVQKLVGYQNYYKIRVGHYRIGLYIDETNQLVEFRHVLHRRDIYRKFP